MCETNAAAWHSILICVRFKQHYERLALLLFSFPFLFIHIMKVITIRLPVGARGEDTAKLLLEQSDAFHMCVAYTMRISIRLRQCGSTHPTAERYRQMHSTHSSPTHLPSFYFKHFAFVCQPTKRSRLSLFVSFSFPFSSRSSDSLKSSNEIKKCQQNPDRGGSAKHFDAAAGSIDHSAQSAYSPRSPVCARVFCTNGNDR